VAHKESEDPLLIEDIEDLRKLKRYNERLMGRRNEEDIHDRRGQLDTPGEVQGEGEKR